MGSVRWERCWGNLGSWTDVYAMCATVYYCMTGRISNAASDCIMEDDNVDWRSIPGLTEGQIETLEKGLALLPENRLQKHGAAVPGTI